MITPKVKGTQVVFGPCRLSYTYLFKKFNPDGGEQGGKYMTNVLIPSGETETLNAIRKAIAEAKAEGLKKKWGGKEPKKLDLPLRDGDDRDKDIDTYAGQMYLNAKCSSRPGIVDPRKNPIVDEDEVYSGIWAVVSVTFYPYDSNGNKGVACGLNNVMKVADGERLGGRSSVESDFADIDIETDDDLM